MTPSFPGAYLRIGGARNTPFLDRILGAYFAALDHANLRLSKHSICVFYSAWLRFSAFLECVSMNYIVLSGHIFKIFRTVVGFIKIPVVYLESFRAWSYERSSYKNVRLSAYGDVINRKNYLMVSLLVKASFDDVRKLMSRPSSRWRYSSYAAKIRDFVESLKAHYCTPFFFHGDSISQEYMP